MSNKALLALTGASTALDIHTGDRAPLLLSAALSVLHAAFVVHVVLLVGLALVALGCRVAVRSVRAVRHHQLAMAHARHGEG